MKKQLLIIGVVTLLVIVGLSGCNENTNNEEEKEAPKGNFIVSPVWEDNFPTILEGGYTGTVWVNVTVTNIGGDGWGTVYTEVYQGIGDYAACGQGYSSPAERTLYLKANETTILHLIFNGVENHNNTGCYGVTCDVL